MSSSERKSKLQQHCMLCKDDSTPAVPSLLNFHPLLISVRPLVGSLRRITVTVAVIVTLCTSNWLAGIWETNFLEGTVVEAEAGVSVPFLIFVLDTGEMETEIIGEATEIEITRGAGGHTRGAALALGVGPLLEKGARSAEPRLSSGIEKGRRISDLMKITSPPLVILL